MTTEVTQPQQPELEQPESTDVAAPSPDETLPDKLRGKTREEIAEMYVNLESVVGRQGRQLGELSQLTSQLLARANPSTAAEPAEVTEEELINQPTKAIKKIVSQELQPLVREVQQSQNAVRRAEFASKHPDYKTIGDSPEFRAWVDQNPYRQQMFQRADNLDYAAADELLSLYKDHRKVVSASTAQTQRTDKAKRLAGERGAGDISAPKVYSRAELQQLRLTNPDKYNSMNDEIVAAYREGRVK